MNGVLLASPIIIRGELGYAHRPQLVPKFIALLGTKFGAHLIWKEDVCRNSALTVGKFVFSNSGNLGQRQIRQSPGLAPNAHSGNDWGPIPVLTGLRERKEALSSPANKV